MRRKVRIPMLNLDKLRSKSPGGRKERAKESFDGTPPTSYLESTQMNLARLLRIGKHESCSNNKGGHIRQPSITPPPKQRREFSTDGNSSNPLVWSKSTDSLMSRVNSYQSRANKLLMTNYDEYCGGKLANSKTTSKCNSHSNSKLHSRTHSLLKRRGNQHTRIRSKGVQLNFTNMEADRLNTLTTENNSSSSRHKMVHGIAKMADMQGRALRKVMFENWRLLLRQRKVSPSGYKYKTPEHKMPPHPKTRNMQEMKMHTEEYEFNGKAQNKGLSKTVEGGKGSLWIHTGQSVPTMESTLSTRCESNKSACLEGGRMYSLQNMYQGIKQMNNKAQLTEGEFIVVQVDGPTQISSVQSTSVNTSALNSPLASHEDRLFQLMQEKATQYYDYNLKNKTFKRWLIFHEIKEDYNNLSEVLRPPILCDSPIKSPLSTQTKTMTFGKMHPKSLLSVQKQGLSVQKQGPSDNTNTTRRKKWIMEEMEYMQIMKHPSDIMGNTAKFQISPPGHKTGNEKCKCSSEYLKVPMQEIFPQSPVINTGRNRGGRILRSIDIENRQLNLIKSDVSKSLINPRLNKNKMSHIILQHQEIMKFSNQEFDQQLDAHVRRHSATGNRGKRRMTKSLVKLETISLSPIVNLKTNNPDNSYNIKRLNTIRSITSKEDTENCDPSKHTLKNTASNPSSMPVEFSSLTDSSYAHDMHNNIMYLYLYIYIYIYRRNSFENFSICMEKDQNLSEKTHFLSFLSGLDNPSISSLHETAKFDFASTLKRSKYIYIYIYSRDTSPKGFISAGSTQKQTNQEQECFCVL